MGKTKSRAKVPARPIEIRPPKATRQQLLRLAEINAAKWPCNLHRWDVFLGPAQDGSNREVLRRAIAWDPSSKTLYAQEVRVGKAPDGGRRLERLVEPGKDLKVLKVRDAVRPPFMDLAVEELKQLCPSSLDGLSRRNMLVNATLMLDRVGNGNPADFVLNDEILFDSQAFEERLNEVLKLLKKQRSYRPYLLELVRKYFHFGGKETALLSLTQWQGGPGVSRVGINKRKPGPLSFVERLAKGAALLEGKEEFARQRPVMLIDIRKMTECLKWLWGVGRDTLERTWEKMKQRLYKHRASRDIPTFRMFKEHAPDIIAKNDFKALRNGAATTAKYNDAMAGSSSDITFGAIEVVDVDGWIPKVGVAVNVNGKIMKTTITVVFAVSRLTGAILGYELALTGENAEAFIRCIASIFLPKQERATTLGLGRLKGLLFGNIDAVFVDNGAGASEAVVRAAVDRMGLIRELAPPGQGQKKGRIESLHAALIRMMAQDKMGATRDNNALAKEMRLLNQRKGVAIPLDDLERYILKAIDYHNLCHDSSHLRTRQMRDKHVGITPAALHKYTQSLRVGDAARTYSVEEINDRFLPWVTRECRKGVVYFNNVRWTSRGLVDFFNEVAKYPGKVRSPTVKVKRLTGYDQVLLWKHPDGSTEQLEMVAEDKRSYGSATWKQIELDHIDDQCQRNTQAKKKPGHRGKMTVREHKRHITSQFNAGNPLAGASGATIEEAKLAAAKQRDQERGAAEAAAYGHKPPLRPTEGPTAVKTKSRQQQANEDYYRKSGLL